MLLGLKVLARDQLAGGSSGRRPGWCGDVRGGRGTCQAERLPGRSELAKPGGGGGPDSWPALWTSSIGGLRRAGWRKREEQSTRELVAISKNSRDLSIN